MTKKLALVFLSGLLVFIFSGVAVAQHGGHGHGGAGVPAHEKDTSHSMPMMKDRVVQSVTVEGLKVSLDIMDMSMHTKMQGMKGNPTHGSGHSMSHALMVTVQDVASKEIISDAKVQYTLIRPSGEKEMGKLAWSGDHYGGGFSPKEKGAYQFQLMVESGGMEREARFIYSPK